VSSSPEPWRVLTQQKEWGWGTAAVGDSDGSWGAMPGEVGPAAWEGWDAAGTQSETPGGKMLINRSASLKGAKCKLDN